MRRVTGVGASLLATALVSGTPKAARAAASAHLVYLRGPGAEGCPGEQAVRAAVSTRLGYDPFFPWARDTLFAEITAGKGDFHVDIKLVDGDNLQRGGRDITVKGNDCSAVIDAMGLTISLTIDPSSITGAAPSSPPSPPPPPPDAPILLSTLAAPRPPDSPRDAPRIPPARRRRPSHR